LKKWGKKRKIGHKNCLCLRRKIGGNREKIEQGGNVVGHFMVATDVKRYKCYGVKKAHFCKCWLSLFFVVAISRSMVILFWYRIYRKQLFKRMIGDITANAVHCTHFQQ